MKSHSANIELALSAGVGGLEKSKISNLTKSQILAALGVSLGSMIVGFSSAWSSPAIASLMEPGSRIYAGEEQASWIGSLMPLTALVGGILGGFLLENMGRKSTIVSTALPFILGSLLVTYAQNVNYIYVGRSVTGLCIGIISLSLPVYLAETIHPDVRGTLGLLPTSLGKITITKKGDSYLTFSIFN